MSSQVLVLNASYEPINICALRRALVLILEEKVEVLASDAVERVHSTYLDMPRPTVIRLIKYAPVPRSRKAYLNRRAVLNRDGHTCVYCGSRATTMDHVIPRSKGGKNIWENVVACCFACNQRKDNKSLAEMGWSLPFKPFTPEGSKRVMMMANHPHPTWEEWLSYAKAS